MDLSKGDRVQIDHPLSDKHGLTGIVSIVMENGAIVQLDQPFNLERPYTPVKSEHLIKL